MKHKRRPMWVDRLQFWWDQWQIGW